MEMKQNLRLMQVRVEVLKETLNFMENKIIDLIEENEKLKKLNDYENENIRNKEIV